MVGHVHIILHNGKNMLPFNDVSYVKYMYVGLNMTS